MALADVRISTDGVTAQVVVNGEEVPGVIGYRWDHGMNEVPVLSLVVKSVDSVIEGQGVVKVGTDQTPANPSDVVYDFLDALDPAELEKAILDSFGMGGPSTGEATLAVLKRWARGER